VVHVTKIVSTTQAIETDSNSTYLESQANITVRANPAVEGGVQNFEVIAHDSNNATYSISHYNYKIYSPL
jgi:hypothetical protein